MCAHFCESKQNLSIETDECRWFVGIIVYGAKPFQVMIWKKREKKENTFSVIEK